VAIRLHGVQIALLAVDAGSKGAAVMRGAHQRCDAATRGAVDVAAGPCFWRSGHV
jgi:hypothetical protein